MLIDDHVDGNKAGAESQPSKSQARCGNAVDNVLAAIAKLPIPPTAKYVGTIMVTMRLIDSKAIAEFTDIPLRTVQRAMLQVSASGAIDAISGAPLAPSAPLVAPERVSRVHAPAQIELPSEVDSTTGEVISPPTPSASEARVGEDHAGHGVFVNCETIRHKAFSISLPGIRMGVIAAGLSADEVKTKCVAHALQWAAEIENGKRSNDVVPAKIQNFLSASIMGEVNRKAVADVRMAKVVTTAPKTSLRQVLNDAKAAREAGAAA